jgi:cysteine desulfurase
MEEFLADRGAFGNPSGGHAVARRAKTALEGAREQVATALGCGAADLVFTSGGTEAANLAVKGAARAARARDGRDRVVTTAFEHKAVLASCDRLASEGFRVRRVGVGADGVVDLDELADSLDERTAVVSVMLVNNEIGTVQPLAEVAALVRRRAPRAVLHTDAVQAVPWLDVATAAAPADLVSVSAHKFGGPKGAGALVVRDGARVQPSVEGGGQEAGFRSGTPDVMGLLGMAAALRATVRDRAADVVRVAAMRDRLVAGLLASVPDVFVNGDPACKVAGNCNVGFRRVEAEALLVALDRSGVSAAAGSSCSSGAAEASHVLLAIGRSREEALASIRLSLGFATEESDVVRALEVVPQAVERLRAATMVSAR